MCKTRRARKLTAGRDGQVYVNAQDVVVFCSVRWAANYGLLWGSEEIENNWHWCPIEGDWVACQSHECSKRCERDYY